MIDTLKYTYSLVLENMSLTTNTCRMKPTHGIKKEKLNVYDKELHLN